MRTTTELTRLFGGAAVVLAGWFGGLAILAYAVEPSGNVIAWAPQSRVPAMISASPVSVAGGAGAGFVGLRGESAGFVRALYAHGAWIVLPVATGGCRCKGAACVTSAAHEGKQRVAEAREVEIVAL